MALNALPPNAGSPFTSGGLETAPSDTGPLTTTAHRHTNLVHPSGVPSLRNTLTLDHLTPLSNLPLHRSRRDPHGRRTVQVPTPTPHRRLKLEPTTTRHPRSNRPGIHTDTPLNTRHPRIRKPRPTRNPVRTLTRHTRNPRPRNLRHTRHRSPHRRSRRHARNPRPSPRVLRVPSRRRIVDRELTRHIDPGIRVGLVIAGRGPAPARPVPIAAHSSS